MIYSSSGIRVALDGQGDLFIGHRAGAVLERRSASRVMLLLCRASTTAGCA